MAYREHISAGSEPIPGYRVSRKLGSGGFGEVWEASDPNGQAVALKFLSIETSHSTTQELRSLQAIRKLTHPHLLRIDQVWSHKGYVIFAMELADGSLSDLLNVYQADYGVALPADHACHYLMQAAKGLDFLNARQHDVGGMRVAIQHCDVKPSNLLLCGNTVKVADFGLSGIISTTTKNFRKAGTLDFCPPEVFRGKLSLNSDQYALAVTYCLLRGRLPFGDTPKNFQADYVRPKPDLSMLTPAELPAIARALDPLPQNRWESCGDLMYRLQLALKGPVPTTREALEGGVPAGAS